MFTIIIASPVGVLTGQHSEKMRVLINEEGLSGFLYFMSIKQLLSTKNWILLERTFYMKTPQTQVDFFTLKSTNNCTISLQSILNFSKEKTVILSLKHHQVGFTNKPQFLYSNIWKSQITKKSHIKVSFVCSFSLVFYFHPQEGDANVNI